MATAAAEAPMEEETAVASVTNRMLIAVLALIGVLISIYMSAYKLGVFGAIICGTSGGCEIVQNSPWSVFMGVPVPFIGLAGYAGMLALAIVGLQPAYATSRRIPLLLFAGAFAGLAFSGYLTYLEAAVIHAWCRWCIISAVLASLLFLAALPELRRLRRP
jgi:uncharacterized membrane protein